MFNFDYKNLKPNADIASILIIFIVSAIVGIYLNYHLIYIIPIFLVLYFLIIAKVVFGKFHKTISFSPFQILFVTLIVTLIIANLYAYYFFKNHESIFSGILNLMIKFEIDFFKDLFTSLSTLLLYIISSFFIGNFVIKNIKIKLDKLAFYFLSIAMGLSILGTIFFIFAGFGYLNLYIAGPVFFFPIIINWQKFITLGFKFKQILTKKIKVDVNIYNIMFSLGIIIFVSTIITSSLRSFIYGPDGLRAYLSLTRYIAENNALPYLKFMVHSPFFTEILISPAYMIGNITNAIFTLNFLSLLYIIGFFLLAKDFISSKNDYLVLIPIILFPPFIQILVGEYKIDIFFTFFSSAVIYTLYKYIKDNNIKFAYLSMFFMSIAFLIKLTAIFYIIPFGIYIAIKILLSNNKFKEVLIKGLLSLIFFLVPILPWITLYKIHISEFGIIGMGISKYAKEIPQFKTNHPCLFEIQAYEEKQYMQNFDKSITGYLKLPFFYLKAVGTKAKTFSLLDAGIFAFASFSIFITWLLLKRKNIITDKTLKTLGMLTVISLIPWFIKTPIYIWYVSPSIMLLTTITYLSILKNTGLHIQQFLIKLTISFFWIYILALTMFYAFATYYPSGLSGAEAVSIFKDEKSAHETYLNNLEIAKVVNKDKTSNILFTSAATFANVNFFINNYFDRSIYLDLKTDTFEEKEVKNIISQFNIKYIIINNIAVDSDMECLSKSQKIAKEVVMKIGDVVLETSAFTLLEIN